MNNRDDMNLDQTLSSYFQTARASRRAPAELWNQVSAGLDRETSRPVIRWGRSVPARRRLIAVAVAVALVAVIAFSPWSDGNGSSPATDLLQKARAAALHTRGVDSVYTRIRVEDVIYENQTEPTGSPTVNEVFHREGWWAGPTEWRFESSIEYFDDGAPADAQPGWLKGGITVADGTNVWTFTDIEPGEGEAPEDLSHPQTHVRALSEFYEVDPGAMFAFGGSFLTGAETADLASILGQLEDCFDARLDGTDEVAGLETLVVRLRPHGVGDRVTGVLDAGSCMSLVRLESANSGERIAEQELILWIDVEHFFILKVEQIVHYAPEEGEPAVLVSRSEVIALELNSVIPAERFEFTPPPDVPIVDER